MKDKKIKELAKEIVQQAITENVNYNHYPMNVNERKGQMDNTEKKSVLDSKCEEADKNEFERKNQQLHEKEYIYKELKQYKKELEKERKSRKKAEEYQKDLKYLIKNLQKQLKEVENNCKRLEKEQQNNYQKLKAVIKKKNKKQKEKINSIKNILRYIIYILGLPFYGGSLKEIEKSYKDESRYIKKSKKTYIEGDYKELS